MRAIGRRVVVNPTALHMYWCKNSYLNVGMEGTVLAQTVKGDKLAIEFDCPIFPLGDNSKYNNGCFGRGRKGYCIYLPTECIRFIDCKEPCIEQSIDTWLLMISI